MTDPIDLVDLVDLADRLGLGHHEHVAVVGGGGKTTVVHGLAGSLTGRRVITTTTKMGHDQHGGLPLLVGATDDEVVAAATDTAGPIVAWGGIDGSRATGVTPETCDRWFGRVDHVLVEADGARRRPFKSPGHNEPVVPATTTRYVIVMGSDALGRVIDDTAHRPERVAALAGCRPSERLTPERAATVLLHPEGFLAHRPPAAATAIVVTKVDPTTASAAARVAAALTERRPTDDLDIVTLARV